MRWSVGAKMMLRQDDMDGIRTEMYACRSRFSSLVGLSNRLPKRKERVHLTPWLAASGDVQPASRKKSRKASGLQLKIISVSVGVFYACRGSLGNGLEIRVWIVKKGQPLHWPQLHHKGL